MDWQIEGSHVVFADGTRRPAITGGGEGGGSGAGAASAMGSAQNIDFTFGQKGVHDDKTKKELAMLMSLINASGSAGSKSVNTGQSIAPAQANGWTPQMLMSFMRMFGQPGGAR